MTAGRIPQPDADGLRDHIAWVCSMIPDTTKHWIVNDLLIRAYFDGAVAHANGRYEVPKWAIDPAASSGA